MTSQNKSLGRFDLSDIPPSPRGMPQIEVAFDIDANGILHVSAKDKATGKEQKIKIQAATGLSDSDIEKMVKDAEEHAEEDRKFDELVKARNQGDAMIHATEKSMKEMGDKVEPDEKTAIDAAIADLREALKTNDKEAIDEKTQALTQASGKMAEKMYAQQPGAEGQPGEQAEQDASAKPEDDNVVDAEFEEVKDDDKDDKKDDDKKD